MAFLQSVVLVVAVAASSLASSCPAMPEERRTFCMTQYAGISITTVTNNWMNEGSRCCPFVVPPIKLLETGNNVVDTQDRAVQARFASAPCAQGKVAAKGCIAPPAFYRQYTNVYTTDYTLGIPILSDNALPESFAVVRRHIEFLLKWTARTLPNIREHLAKAYIRVLINSCGNYHRERGNDWSKHPEAFNTSDIEIGGAERSNPSVGCEESNIPSGTACYDSPRFPSELEEFFHTIHHVGMLELDPDAFVAITCLAARDTGLGRYGRQESSEDDGDGSPAMQPVPVSPLPPPPTAEQRIAAVTKDFGGDFLATVGLEYYVSAIAMWMGTPLHDLAFDVGGRTLISRAALKEQVPDLACLVARYFPVMGEDGGTYCPVNGSATGEACRRYPGSCFCGSMSAAYLGPPLNRSACPSLRQIKEMSGYKDKQLPGNARGYQCKGCIGAGCDKDRGAVRTAAPFSNFTTSPGNTGDAGATVQIYRALVLVAATLAVSLL